MGVKACVLVLLLAPVAVRAMLEVPEDEIPALPQGVGEGGVPKLRLGDVYKLDGVAQQYGPTILNKDGTMRRIENWEEMSDAERERAWKRIVERNARRRRTLEAGTGAGRSSDVPGGEGKERRERRERRSPGAMAMAELWSVFKDALGALSRYVDIFHDYVDTALLYIGRHEDDEEL